MANMMELVVAAVGGVITIFIFLEILAVFSWGNTNISSGALALLAIVDLAIAASIIIMVVVFGFAQR